MSANIKAVFRGKLWPLWEDDRCSEVCPYSGLDCTKCPFLFIIELEEHNLQQSFIGRDPIG